MRNFLRKHGHLATSDELMAIIRRMDLDADARLSQQEFIEGITPAEPYSKMLKRVKIKEANVSTSNMHLRNHSVSNHSYS